MRGLAEVLLMSRDRFLIVLRAKIASEKKQLPCCDSFQSVCMYQAGFLSGFIQCPGVVISVSSGSSHIILLFFSAQAKDTIWYQGVSISQ